MNKNSNFFHLQLLSSITVRIVETGREAQIRKYTYTYFCATSNTIYISQGIKYLGEIKFYRSKVAWWFARKVYHATCMDIITSNERYKRVERVRAIKVELYYGFSTQSPRNGKTIMRAACNVDQSKRLDGNTYWITL